MSLVVQYWIKQVHTYINHPAVVGRCWGGVEIVEAGDLSGKSHNIQEEKVVNVGMRERVEDVKKVGNAIISVMTVK